MKYEELRSEWQDKKEKLAIKVSRKETLIAQKEAIEKKISELGIDSLENCFNILNNLSDKQRNAAKETLEELGTEALKYSYDPCYRMKIVIPEKTGSSRRQAFVYIVDENTNVETDPLSDNGGGIVDLISIAMRIVILVTYEDENGELDGPIILDEPFKMLSEEYVPMAMEFLKKVSNDFDRQIIMITHNRYFAESSSKVVVIGDEIDERSRWQ